MQNVKTHIVVGATEGEIDKNTGKPEREITVLYIGGDRRKAREIFLVNKDNLDFDFVGMDSLAGFKSRGRPKVDAQVRKDRAAAMAKETENEITQKARIADAAAVAAGKAQLAAEAELEAAEEKLAELRSQADETEVSDDDELEFVGDDELGEAVKEDDEINGEAEVVFVDEDEVEPEGEDDTDTEDEDEDDEDAALAALIAEEEEAEKNGK